MTLRLVPLILATLLVGCAPAPPTPNAQVDPTAEAWYPKAAAELSVLAQKAESLYSSGDYDKAAALVSEGQPVLNRLIGVPQPTLAALEAVSDLDDLYARLLLRNRHYNWARTLYQKNVYRWKNRKPQTEDTARRLATARAGVAECERHIGE